jgi:hypothetical protein
MCNSSTAIQLQFAEIKRQQRSKDAQRAIRELLLPLPGTRLLDEIRRGPEGANRARLTGTACGFWSAPCSFGQLHGLSGRRIIE